MTPRLSGHFFWFGFLCAHVSAVNCMTMGREKVAILSLKPRSHVIISSNDPGKVDSNFFCYAATGAFPT